MPLKLALKKGERLVVNGAVIEVIGNSTDLVFHNPATILRERDILNPKDAQTPASRVYYSVQCMYLFPDKRAYYSDLYKQFLDDYVGAAPSARELGEAIRTSVDREDYYRALRVAQSLVDHERGVLKDVESAIGKLAAEGGLGETEGIHRDLGAS